MDGQTGAEDATHRVRPATAEDLHHLAAVEDSGAQQYADHFGPAVEPVLLSPASDGRWRARQPGFVLVVGQERPVGFAHVLEIEGHAHLEQLSVRPEHQRRGLGRALVEAAETEARSRGFARLSLCTYRDVPWNGPYYESLGFREVPDAEQAPFQRRLREKERDLRLDVNGARCVMDIALG
ncbi:GNAT family N-acetyltransferase [Nocardioides anomalus]|uniref:GNAT family N-acetyltransferase n=1 Tax=Nocardioides anomalus TaxID=2712223 RepID=A0A6G6WEZ7_9ACTN|nr:GNAT family N-acetyltransferase [Nocardioides anomalus]QIG43812.1 GNAT family N-acetyltransferase [Nocardioides anomalus]